MNKIFSAKALAAFLVSALAMSAAPVLTCEAQAAQAAPAKQEAAKPAETKPAAKPAAAKPVAKSDSLPGKVEDGDKLQRTLDAFAKSCAANMNESYTPCITRKEVLKTPAGYTARYIMVDIDTMQTSYKKTEESTKIPYVGYMRYHEVEYTCSAATKEEAMKGPFQESKRRPLTELVKYMNGKWTY